MLSEAVEQNRAELVAHAKPQKAPELRKKTIWQGAQGRYGAAGKRALDLAGAFGLMLLFSPVMLMVALLVRVQGRGVIFGHERIGRDGYSFRCYKFRSMVPDAERRLQDLLARDPEARREWAENHKLDNDPRITRLGHFLRRSSLDELPQLWNVLRGDMSLVGPRPVTLPELERYGDSVGAYLALRPGLTGPWQVSGRNNISYDERVRMDRDYAMSCSLAQDVLVLLRTVRAVVVASGK